MKNSALSFSIVLVSLCALPFVGRANTIFTINNATADTFLVKGPTGNLVNSNYGGAGAMQISGAATPNGEMTSLVKFNFGGAVNQFNSTYGAGNWQITGLTLSLAGNFGAQGEAPNNGIFNAINAGSFGIDWLANDAWVEGNGIPASPSATGVNFNSIPALYSLGSASLGTYSFTPPGDNVYLNFVLPLNSSLVNDAAAGGDVSLYFYAADSQIAFLFNSRTGPNHPQFIITAVPVPEPATSMLIAAGAAGLIALRIRNRRA
jgi:hypothetical protein